MAATLDAANPVRLLVTMAGRCNEVRYGVFVACSPDTHVQVCRRVPGSRPNVSAPTSTHGSKWQAARPDCP
jgi:hypothetical protein